MKAIKVVLCAMIFVMVAGSVILYSSSACAGRDGVLVDSSGRPVLGCSVGGRGC